MTTADDLSEMPKISRFRCGHLFSAWLDLESGVTTLTARYMRVPNAPQANPAIHSAIYRSSGSMAYKVKTARSRVILVLIVIYLIYAVLSDHRI